MRPFSEKVSAVIERRKTLSEDDWEPPSVPADVAAREVSSPEDSVQRMTAIHRKKRDSASGDIAR